MLRKFRNVSKAMGAARVVKPRERSLPEIEKYMGNIKQFLMDAGKCNSVPHPKSK